MEGGLSSIFIGAQIERGEMHPGYAIIARKARVNDQCHEKGEIGLTHKDKRGVIERGGGFLYSTQQGESERECDKRREGLSPLYAARRK